MLSDCTSERFACSGVKTDEHSRGPVLLVSVTSGLPYSVSRITRSYAIVSRTQRLRCVSEGQFWISDEVRECVVLHGHLFLTLRASSESWERVRLAC